MTKEINYVYVAMRLIKIIVVIFGFCSTIQVLIIQACQAALPFTKANADVDDTSGEHKSDDRFAIGETGSS